MYHGGNLSSSRLPLISVIGPTSLILKTPLSLLWGIPLITSATLTIVPSWSIFLPLSIFVFWTRENLHQPMTARWFPPISSIPTIMISTMGQSSLRNLSGGSIFVPSQSNGNNAFGGTYNPWGSFVLGVMPFSGAFHALRGLTYLGTITPLISL